MVKSFFNHETRSWPPCCEVECHTLLFTCQFLAFRFVLSAAVCKIAEHGLRSLLQRTWRKGQEA